MNIDQNVRVTVPRYTTELVNLLDLLVNRIEDIRENVPGEFDLYVYDDDPRKGILCRVVTWRNLSKADVDLFKDDSRMFWEMQIDKATNTTLRELINGINTIRYLGWGVFDHLGWRK